MPSLEKKLENLEGMEQENNLMHVKVELLEAKYQSVCHEKAAVTRELACVRADVERYEIEHNILSSQANYLLMFSRKFE